VRLRMALLRQELAVSILLVVLIAVCLPGVATAQGGAVDWHTFPRPQPDEIVEIYHLAAPLLEWKYGNLFSYFDLFHAAIGFRYRTTKFEFTYEYLELEGIQYALIPEITKYPNGSVELTWHTKVGGVTLLGINCTYFNSVCSLVGNMTGKQFMEWEDTFLENVNKTYPVYNLFVVMDDKTHQHRYFNSCTCMDHAWLAFETTHKFGAVFDHTLHEKNEYINLYVGNVAPRLVDYGSDQKETKRVNEFFELLEAKFKYMDVWELIKTLLLVFRGEVYIKHDQDLYALKLHFPWLNIPWKEYPLP